MTIVVREMNIDDLEKVLEIERECFTTPWSEEAFRMEVEKNMLAKYIVVEDEDEISGYGGIWLIFYEGHITNIAVHSRHRAKGIGNFLVEGLIALCKKREIYRMTLEVRVSNIVAQSLYKKYGFKEEGVRPRYYSDTNEDALIMWKEF